MIRGLRHLLAILLYVAVFLSLFFAACLIFYEKVESFYLYHPFSSLDRYPETGSYKDVHFRTVDGETLHGWFFPGRAQSPVLLFCHGNAGNISHRLDNIQRLLRAGLGVFIFDYRGFGKSTGKPSEMGLYLDGLAAFDWLTGEGGVSPERVVFFGRSLGASVALETALSRNARAVIIESPFTSTRAMAGTIFPFMLIAPLLPENFDNRRKIAALEKPVMVIHGERDEIVPFRMGEELYRLAPEPKSFYPIPGAGHNDTYFVGGKTYFDRLSAFAFEPG